MSPRRLAVAALLLLPLAACGDETGADSAGSDTSTASESPSASSPSAGGVPACADVWVDGATLPEQYAGCLDDSGEKVPADATQCATGARLVTYDERFYAMTGHVVNDEGSLADSTSYASAKASCGG